MADETPPSPTEPEHRLEVEAQLLISEGIDPTWPPYPRRGHYADLEVAEAILRSDPRDRASSYDADPRQIADALRNIIDTFSPAAEQGERGGVSEEELERAVARHLKVLGYIGQVPRSTGRSEG